MNRLLKFRIWCNENGERVMIYDHSLHDLLPANWSVIMQFTGLYDKNGKEIYEGDIVQVFYDKSEQTEADKCYTVVIRDMVEDKFSGVGRGRGKVIGNLYQNPELLAV